MKPNLRVNMVKASNFRQGQKIVCSTLPDSLGALIDNDEELPAKLPAMIEDGILEAGDQFEARFSRVYGNRIAINVELPLKKVGFVTLPSRILAELSQTEDHNKPLVTANIEVTALDPDSQHIADPCIHDLRKSIQDAWNALKIRWCESIFPEFTDVKVLFTLACDGNLAKMQESSRCDSSELTMSAINAIKQAAPYIRQIEILGKEPRFIASFSFETALNKLPKAPLLAPREVGYACFAFELAPEEVKKQAVEEAYNRKMYSPPDVNPNFNGNFDAEPFFKTAKETLLKWIDDGFPPNK